MGLIRWLATEIENPPVPYGWYHLIMLFLTIGLTIVFCIFNKNASDKKFRRTILICWIIFVVLELYKQITYSTNWEGINGATSTYYEWYFFPMQFCSSPFYVLPFIAFLPEGKVRDAFMSFVSTFVLFAGIAVMFYPNDVFTYQIGINIQTMVHHGMQVFLGVYITVYNRKKYFSNIKDIIIYCLLGVAVFAGLAVIAIILNEALVKQYVNFFFISRHVPCSLPILGTIYTKAPYAIFLITYLFGFMLIAAIFTAIELLCVRLTSKKANA